MCGTPAGQNAGGVVNVITACPAQYAASPATLSRSFPAAAVVGLPGTHASGAVPWFDVRHDMVHIRRVHVTANALGGHAASPTAGLGAAPATHAKSSA